MRPRPTFVEFIYFVDNRIKYPDITATLTRDSPPLTQLDGISMMELEEQPRRAMLERQQEDVIRQIASDTGTSSHLLRGLTILLTGHHAHDRLQGFGCLVIWRHPLAPSRGPCLGHFPESAIGQNQQRKAEMVRRAPGSPQAPSHLVSQLYQRRMGHLHGPIVKAANTRDIARLFESLAHAQFIAPTPRDRNICSVATNLVGL